MSFYDLPLEQLQAYKPQRDEPDDFDAFWAQTLEETRRFPLNATFHPVETGLKMVEVFDVTYNGYGGQPIKGWLILPTQRSGPQLPCVVEYIGYGGGRGLPTEWLLWGSVGYAHLVMDTRGQGSAWKTGDTPDLELFASNPQYPGFMTRGVLDPATYYYRRVFTDAVRAVEAARAHPVVDGSRIALSGGSQGGGITIAAGALSSDISAIMPDVPFLCHYRVATEITDKHPYEEIAQYCKIHRDKVDTVFKTLSYFDGVNFSAHSKANALFSVGLMDEICPPRSVYAAYNHHMGPKQISIYRYNHHEGGQGFQDREKIKFLQQLWQ